MKPTRRDIIVWGVLTLGALALVVLGVWSRSAPRAHPAPRVFGEVPEFVLTNRDGKTLQRGDLVGSPWIADFIFTRCAGICPFMTRRMLRLAGELPESPVVNMVSFTADPEHDTPEVLDEYARRHDASWYFLTGGFEEIQTLSREGFLLGLDAADPNDPKAEVEPVIHSNRFVLVDGRGRIRGYYDAFDEGEVRRLVLDLEWLLEHDG